MKKLGDFTDVDDRRLVADAVALAERENTVAAEKYAYLAEIERRGLALALGASSIPRWWARGTRVTDGAAAKQVDHATWLSSWPEVRTALYRADIHLAHTVAIHDGLVAVSNADEGLTDDAATAVVEDLLDTARTGTSHTVARRASTLALAAAREARLRAEKVRDEAEKDRAATNCDSDTPPPEPTPDPLPPPPVLPAENSELNRFSIHRLPNGRNRFEGDFDVLTTARLKAALDPHSAPRPGPDGERDPRPASQRAADALCILLDRDAAAGQRPTFAGTIDLAALAGADSRHPPDGDGEWPFELSWGGPMSRALALLVTCDSQMNPVVVDGAGVPLAMGRSVRTVTPDLRLAVTARDRCCVMCGRPPQWCQVHHLVHWADQGTTDLDNLALLCGECHRQVHQQGWEIVMGIDRHPRIIPPDSVDRLRQPRQTHHRQRRRDAA